MGGTVSDLSNKMKKVSLDDSSVSQPENAVLKNGGTMHQQGYHTEELNCVLNANDLVEELTGQIQAISLATGELKKEDTTESHVQELKVAEEVLSKQVKVAEVKVEEVHSEEVPTKQEEKVNDEDVVKEVKVEEVPKTEAETEEDKENADSGAESGDDSEENETDTQVYQPVIPLPPLVQEEDQEVALLTIVEYRAKLYRFDSATSQWKERGVGSIKLLESTMEPNKFRVTMWRDSIGKVACNFSLFPDFSVKNFQNDPKVLCWQCFDCSEDEPRWETLTCRFGTEEKCSDFKTKLLEYAKLQAVPVKVKEEESSSCEGCRGCSPDTYEFPVTNTAQKSNEPLIDYPLDTDSYSGSPCLFISSTSA